MNLMPNNWKMKIIKPKSDLIGISLLLNPKRRPADADDKFHLSDVLMPLTGNDDSPLEAGDTDGDCRTPGEALWLNEALDQFLRDSSAPESGEDDDQISQETGEDRTVTVPAHGFEIVSSQNPSQPQANQKTSTDLTNDTRRRCERLRLSIPARVTGYDQDEGEWSEDTETVDVSRTGLIVQLCRRMQHGRVLHLSLPLPDELRSQDRSELNYEVYAIVRRIESASNGSRVVGMEFLGEQPPEGYFERPWACFQVKRPYSFERRRRSREAASDVIWIDYLDESMQCVTREASRTEDISSGGMRVRVKAAPPEFEMVKIGYANSAFESYAVICNSYVGGDGMNRLCLQFLDKNWYCDESRKEGGDEISSKPDPRGKILLADDDPPLRKVLGKILTQAGYEVIMAEDGKSAVEKFEIMQPDLVITDVLMPKMNGFQVCKLLKESASPPKVILLSGVYSKPSYRRQARNEYGADDLLPKPFEVAVLLSRVKQHLSNPEAVRSM